MLLYIEIKSCYDIYNVVQMREIEKRESQKNYETKLFLITISCVCVEMY